MIAHVVPRIRSSSGTRRADIAPTTAPQCQQRRADAIDSAATANHGTDRRSGGFGLPEVAETATSRVAICNSHRPPTSPRGRARHTAASDLPATIADQPRGRRRVRAPASAAAGGRRWRPRPRPTRTAHAPRTIATSAEAHEDQQRDDGERIGGQCRLPRRATVDVRSRLEAGSVELRGEEHVRARRLSAASHTSLAVPAPGCSKSSAGCSVAMSMIANLAPTPGNRLAMAVGRTLQPAAAGLDRDDAVARGLEQSTGPPPRSSGASWPGPGGVTRIATPSIEPVTCTDESGCTSTAASAAREVGRPADRPPRRCPPDELWSDVAQHDVDRPGRLGRRSFTDVVLDASRYVGRLRQAEPDQLSPGVARCQRSCERRRRTPRRE